jgi:flagellar hook-length control protein FliK
MSVAPDLLLQSAPDVRMKMPVVKAPVKTDDTSKSEASSFADMYAKERQTKSAERSDAPTKPRHEKNADNKRSDDRDDTTAKAKPEVADSGKALPSEKKAVDDAPAEEQAQKTDQPTDQPIDPLVLMGLVPQPLAPTVVAQPAVEAPSALAPDTAAIDLAAIPAAVVGEGELQPQVTDSVEDLLPPGLTLPDDFQAAQAVVAQQAKAVANQTVNAEAAKAPLDPALAAPLLDQLPADGEAIAALKLGDLDADSDAGELKDGIGELRAENFANKLNSLNQAMTQQVNGAQRAALVPGQPVPMQQNGWTEAVVDRVMWLSSQNLKSAEIQLDPQDLGRLDVKISLNQDQTQIAFASPHAAVREALEGQMNRLRDMFTQQGMNLADVNVSDQSLARGWQGQGSEGQGRGGSSSRGGSGGGDDEVVIGSVELPSTPKAGRGLVDYYA